MFELIIHLLFVQPSGETYTDQEKIETIQAVHDAAQFWGYTAIITSSDILKTDKDVFNEPISDWSTLSVAPQNEVYIFVIDNSNSGSLLFGYGGYAQNYYRLIAVVNKGAQAAHIAHELGHIIYDLPDWYKIPGKCMQIDIMCDSEPAYNQHFKGFDTMRFIGEPVYQIALPVVVAPQYGIAQSGKIC